MRAYFGFIFDFVCVCVFLISWVTFWAVKRIFVFIKDGKQKFRPHLFSLSQSSFFDKQCAMLVGLLVLLASCSATSTYPFLRLRSIVVTFCWKARFVFYWLWLCLAVRLRVRGPLVFVFRQSSSLLFLATRKARTACFTAPFCTYPLQ